MGRRGREPWDEREELVGRQSTAGNAERQGKAEAADFDAAAEVCTVNHGLHAEPLTRSRRIYTHIYM